jgi:hypothetical protein
MSINRETAALDEARPRSGASDDVLTGAVRRLADRQAAIAKLTARFLEQGR